MHTPKASETNRYFLSVRSLYACVGIENLVEETQPHDETLTQLFHPNLAQYIDRENDHLTPT